MAVEHMKTWTIGEVEIVRVVELYDFHDDIWVLLDNATPEQTTLKHDWLAPHFVSPDGRMRMNFQAFAVTSRGRKIMVDTCLGNGRKRQFDVFTDLQTSFIEDLAHAGYHTDEIDTVLCTHLHIDHCGWNTRWDGTAWVPTFPNARYLFSRKELDYWEEARAEGKEHMDHVDDSLVPVLEAGLVDFVEPNHQITDEIRLIPTPGHTPGHVSVHISSAGQEAVITGDVVHHPVQFAEPDWTNNFDIDKDAGRKGRRDFFALYEDQPTIVIGSHFADPGSGRIVRDGDLWRFKPD